MVVVQCSVLVFFLERDGWPVTGGHETTGNWRRGFQGCDGEGNVRGTVDGSSAAGGDGGTWDGQAMRRSWSWRFYFCLQSIWARRELLSTDAEAA